MDFGGFWCPRIQVSLMQQLDEQRKLDCDRLALAVASVASVASVAKCCEMLQQTEKQGRQGRGPLRRRKRSWKLPDIGAIGTSAFLAEFMHYFESFGLS